MKPKRILTNRNFSYPESYETIEKDSNGYFFWKGYDEFLDIDFGFPVEEWFVKEKFEEVGRIYKSV